MLARLRLRLSQVSIANLLPKCLVLLALAVLLFFAWREFWFLTDDAFITFRYIDNHRRGWGYVWNPPPFQPVEGYSNFLWAVILEAVWVVTGLSPPSAANTVSLVLAYGTLSLVFLAVWRTVLPEKWRRWRFLLALGALLYTLTNRTFITWTSSGLETALFVFCTTLWLFGVLELSRNRKGWTLTVASTGAAAAALTRPEGILLVVTTLLLSAFRPWHHRKARNLFLLSPLAVVPAHLLWRRAFYGQWVPNTYYAKLTSAWPDAGLRYLASYFLEYGVWAWLLLGLAALAILLWRVHREGLPAGRIGRGLPLAIAASAFVGHLISYGFVLGGDHFEYRACAHLIPAMALALARFVVVLPGAPWVGLVGLTAAVAAAQPIPWIHYARTRSINTRDQTFKMFVPVADAFPAGPLRQYALAFDNLQKWMMPRHVGTRHQEHKMFWLDQIGSFPSRNNGKLVHWNGHPVFTIQTIGVPGWVMPEVAIVDFHGLTDRVVAHNPVGEPPAMRLLAHERHPPEGYIECFEPNVVVDSFGVIVVPRKTPLTDERIRDCEDRFWKKDTTRFAGR